MEKYEFRKLPGIMAYLVIFSVVGMTTILRYYDKISPELTSAIFGFILGVMLSTLQNAQKEWLK